MIFVLKIILALMAIALVFIGRFVYQDFSQVKKTEGFDLISIWEKIKFNATFYFILMALSSLFVFLIYFTFVPMQIS